MSDYTSRALVDYCEWWPLRAPRPCYAPASLVLVRPVRKALRFSCAAHRDAWAECIRGMHSVLDRADWQAWGSGYRGPMLGG